MKLQPFLDEMGVRYQVAHHDIAFTSQDLAAKQHISGHQVIKPVVVQADGQFVMCALPASYRVDLDELRQQLQVKDVKLADEAELGELCRDCELGAEPPIGRFFGIPTIMDEALFSDETVTFQAGTHTDSITMTLADYRRVAQPEVGHFARKL